METPIIFLRVMADVIGKFYEKPVEMRGEWQIPDFLSLEDRVDKYYWSGKFFFSDACWELKIYPNGETELHSEGWIGLYLHRGDWGPPLTVNYSLGVKKLDGTEEILFRRESRSFSKEKGGWGAAKLLERSDLLNRESDLTPSGVLTITCTLKSSHQPPNDVSLHKRLWNASVSLQGVLTSAKRTDVVLKLKDGDMRAHRAVLEARSEVFERMFSAGMQEAQTGEVKIEDGDRGAFSVALSYVYGGDPTGLSSKNVCKVYAVAHKYALAELARLCAEFMQGCLSTETVCDVIAVAELYEETETMQRAKKFFVNNAAEIVQTDKWRIFKRESPALVSELLEDILVQNASRIKV